MSLAWTTVAFLVLLLPGFLFIVALYGQIPREIGLKSPLAQLAASVLVSLFIHGSYYALVDPIVHRLFDIYINIDYLLSLLQIFQNTTIPINEIADNISTYRRNIFSYLIITSLIGYLIGKAIGYCVISGKLPGKALIQHGWLRDLILKENNSVTFAYILTRIQSDGKALMYKGVVKDFFANVDGSLSHIVLTEAERFHMDLNDTKLSTSLYQKIGTSSKNHGPNESSPIKPLWRNLMIEGQDISNICFERQPVPKFTDDEFKNFDNLVMQLKSKSSTESHLQ